MMPSCLHLLILETRQTSKILPLGLPKSPNTVGYNVSPAMRWSFRRKIINLEADIFEAPVWNQGAGPKLEPMELEMPEQYECEKKEQCGPNSSPGRIYRFKRVYSLDIKIEGLFSGLKERFKMAYLYPPGIGKIRGHTILKLINLMPLPTNFTGTYGV